jgi:hypothetical protein
MSKSAAPSRRMSSRRTTSHLAPTFNIRGRNIMSMSLSNRISFAMPEEDMQAVLAALAVLQQKLVPNLIDLGVDDRRALPKMGAKSVDFVGKALKYARDNPELKPGFVDLDEFERDLSAVDALRALQRPLNKLADMVDDSVVLSGSEAYAAALSFYQATKNAARRGHPGAALIADDLAAQFLGRGGKGAAAAVITFPAGATKPASAE